MVFNISGELPRVLFGSSIILLSMDLGQSAILLLLKRLRVFWIIDVVERCSRLAMPIKRIRTAIDRVLFSIPYTRALVGRLLLFSVILPFIIFCIAATITCLGPRVYHFDFLNATAHQSFIRILVGEYPFDW